jgi:hypothetical protein
MNYSKPIRRTAAGYAGRMRASYRSQGTVKNLVWAMAALVALGVLIAWLGPPKLAERRRELLGESLVAAERARASGDLYRALDAYIHAEQMASSIDDWRGLLAVACGLEKVGGQEMPSLYGFNVITKAMASAERQKSAEGMRAVAGAFASLGASYASFALSRIGDGWANDGQGGPTLDLRPSIDLAAVAARGC